MLRTVAFVIFVVVSQLEWTLAVVTDTDESCSKLYEESSGTIHSPSYPREYPNNAFCTWVISVHKSKRIRISFKDFYLEDEPGCVDSLIVKDNVHANGTILAKFCGRDGQDKEITSFGHQMVLIFISDQSIGRRGLKVEWTSIDRISLGAALVGEFLSPWKGVAGPLSPIDFDSGLAPNSLWVVDRFNDVFYYDGSQWELIEGKMKSITVSESGIFAMDPEGFILLRVGASFEYPRGNSWKEVAENTMEIRVLESAPGNLLLGVDKNGVLYHADISSSLQVDDLWNELKPPLLSPLASDLKLDVTDAVQSISCGYYSCWLVTTHGLVYATNKPRKPAERNWMSVTAPALLKSIDAGFGDNILAFTELGRNFKRAAVGARQPLGASWVELTNSAMTVIKTGVGGVFATDKRGYFASYKDAICGGLLWQTEGELQSPNFPYKYPPNLACSWIIQPSVIGSIEMKFDDVFEVSSKPDCADYLLTTYAGITEPIVECGAFVTDKFIEADQVWIEFRTDNFKEGKGFKATYRAGLSYTPAPTTKASAIPNGWDRFAIPKLPGNPGWKIVYQASPVTWLVDMNGRAYVLDSDGDLRRILDPSIAIASLSIGAAGRWAADREGNTYLIAGDSSTRALAQLVTSNMKIAQVFSGSSGVVMGLTDSSKLVYRYGISDSYPAGQGWMQPALVGDILPATSLAPSLGGVWIVSVNNDIQFARVFQNTLSGQITLVLQESVPKLSLKIKKVVLTSSGGVWALTPEGHVLRRLGISTMNPAGVSWETIVSGTVADIFQNESNIFMKLLDGELVTGNDISDATPAGWIDVPTTSPIYMLDAYPIYNAQQMVLWYLDVGGKSFCRIIDSSGKPVSVASRKGDQDFLHISTGESGVWGVDKSGRVLRFVDESGSYDCTSGEWRAVNQGSERWTSVESASPLDTVYALNENGQVYIREDVSDEKPLGVAWKNTGVSAKRISSGSYATFLVMPNGDLSYFLGAPNFLRQGRFPVASGKLGLVSDISAGFDGSLSVLTSTGTLQMMVVSTARALTDKSEWRFVEVDGVDFTDISAGPVTFAVRNGKVLAKPVTKCFLLTKSEGIFSLEMAPRSQSCLWLFSNPDFVSVRGEVTRKMHPPSPGCEKVLLYSESGDNPTENLKEYCGDADLQFTTSGNRSFVQYINPSPTDEDVLAIRLFGWEKKPVCGGTVTGIEGLITSPKFPQNYQDNLDCNWEIRVASGQAVEIFIETMDIERSEACVLDYLRFIDGPQSTGTVLRTECGQKRGISLRGSANSSQMFVLFHSDSSVNREGFRLRWTAYTPAFTKPPFTTKALHHAGCGGSLQGTSGSVSSPNWPSAYENNLACEWTVQASPGDVLQLNFKDVDLEDHAQCLYDYVEVKDGLTQQKLARLCGQKVDVKVTASGHKVLLKFVSDSSTTYKGFRLSWLVLVATTMPYVTPSAESKLPEDWKYHTRINERVTVVSSNAFNGETWLLDARWQPYHYNKVNESYEAFGTQNLVSVSAGVQGVWGVTPDGKVVVKTSVDSMAHATSSWESLPGIAGISQVVSGLKFVFAIAKTGVVYYREGISADKPIGTGWKDMGMKAKSITDGLLGIWIVDASGKLTTQSSLTSSQVLFPSSPDLFFVKIVSGFGRQVFGITNDGSLYLFDGRGSPSLGKSWQPLKLSVADVAPHNSGIFAILKNNEKLILRNDPQCGGVLTTVANSISYPAFSSVYESNVYCLWYIHVPDATKILIRQDRFQLEDSVDCIKDRLTFTAVKVAESEFENWTYCGSGMKVPEQTISGNQVLVEFVSDNAGNYGGFALFYDAATQPENKCTVANQGNMGLLTSPNYPQTYMDNLDCTYAITADEEKVITLMFDDFSVEKDSGCAYDFVEVRDGSTSKAPLLGRYCGDQRGFHVKASGNEVFVRFKTDASGGARGFKTSWVAKERPPLVPTQEPLPVGWKFVTDDRINFTKVNGGFNSRVVALDSMGYAYLRDGLQWRRASDERLLDISSGIAGTWAVRLDGSVVFADYISSTEKSIQWNAITDKVKGIELGSNYDVYGISRNGHLIYRTGVSDKYPSGTSFLDLEVETAFVSAGLYGIWRLDLQDHVYFARGTRDRGALKFDSVPGEFKYIDAGRFGEVYAIDHNSNVFRRAEVTNRNPLGNAWTAENLKLVSITSGKDGIFGVTRFGRIVEKEVTNYCFQEMSDKVGSIRSPNFPSAYPKATHCLWLVHIPGASAISLQFNIFDLENTEQCVNDYVFLSSRGSTLTQPSEKTFCGSSNPGVLRLESNEVWVEFVSNDQVEEDGFEIVYRAEHYVSTVSSSSVTFTTQSTVQKTATSPPSGCGRTFQGPSGVLTSPNFPGSYPRNSQCDYIIQVSPDKAVRLEFGQFSLEPDSACRYDYLIIYEFSGGDYKEVSRLCGSELPGSFTSSSHLVKVFMKSDGSQEFPGFKLFYLEVDRSSNLFMTPKLVPDAWKLISSDVPFESVAASFWSPAVWGVASGGIPYYHDSTSSRWVRVVDVPSSEISSVSPGRYGVWAVTRSGHLFYRQGVTTVDPAGTNWVRIENSEFGMKAVHCGPNNEVVGVTRQGQLVVRIGISSQKPTGTTWKVIGTGYKSVALSLYGYWIVDTGNQVFFASYTPSSAIVNSLSLVPITGSMAKVSAGFGGNVWAIDSGGFVHRRLNMNTLNPSGTAWSREDGLKLSDISAGYDATYGVTLNREIVRRSDVVCGGYVFAPSGSFQSPNFPLKYPAQSNCVWKFEIPGVQEITIFFKTFDVELSASCHKDYVLMAKDGFFPSKFAVQRVCGNEIGPQRFQGSQAWVEFFSDADSEGVGFMAEWTSKDHVPTAPPPTKIPTQTTSPGRPDLTTREPSGDPLLFKLCGGTLSGTKGKIVHPSYPERYVPSRDCTYTITVAPGKKILLVFESLDLERSSKCSYDFVSIQDRASLETRVYCGVESDRTFLSTGSSVLVRFYSDESGVADGFALAWTAIDDPGGAGKTSTATPSRELTAPTLAVTTRPQPAIATTSAASTTASLKKRDCGGVYSDTSGYLTHPNYPRPYPNEADCLWTVRAAPGFAIELDFKFFQVDSSGDCTEDYLVIYDGAEQTSQQLSRLCGDRIPAKIRSSGSAISVRMVTNEEKVGRGFVIKYLRVIATTPSTPVVPATTTPSTTTATTSTPTTTASTATTTTATTTTSTTRSTPTTATTHSATFTRQLTSTTHLSTASTYRPSTSNDPTTATRPPPPGCFFENSGFSGQVLSPNYPKPYSPNVDCMWKLTVRRDQVIQMAFLFVDLEPDENCARDSLEIIDGPYEIGSRVGRFCGALKPQMIMSDTNVIALRFRADGENERKGFRINWRAVPRELGKATTGVPTTQRTTVQVTTLPPGDICGGVFTARSGEIRHPGYPQSYRPNLDCIYQINAPPGFVISMEFVLFEIEDSPQCRSDFVAVSVGTGSNPMTRRYCGSRKPTTITSTANMMAIRFRTNGIEEAKGFLAKYHFTEEAKPTTLSSFTTASSQACGGDLSGTSGTFTSPGYPLRYENGKSCSWTINVPTGRRIRLEFESIQLEESSSCSDYVLVADGKSAVDQVISKFCSSNPGPLYSTGNHMYVKFVSDYQINAAGFIARWRSDVPETTPKLDVTSLPTTTASPLSTSQSTTELVVEVCGGVFTARSGEIRHPGYPQSYRPNLDCIYQINAPPGFVISMEFVLFEIEDSPQCRSDFVAVSVGTGSNPMTRRYCGSRKPTAITSTANMMAIRFRTNGIEEAKGFLAKYHFTEEAKPTTFSTFTTVASSQVLISTSPPAGEGIGECGGKQIGSGGRLVHPGFPKPYGNNLECDWLLHTEPGQFIKLVFTSFGLEAHSDCLYDFLEIFDGSSPSDRKIGKFCGRDPGTIVSSGHKLFVRFRSNGQTSGVGFDGRWIAEVMPELTTLSPALESGVNICQGSVLRTGDSDVLVSPNFPNLYPNSRRCAVAIISNPGTVIHIDFTKFDLEPGASGDCRYDYLLIRDGDSAGNVLQRLCGPSLPISITSSGNQVFIEFVSDASSPYGGFRLRWKSLPKPTLPPTTTRATPTTAGFYADQVPACGGKWFGRNGTVENPSFTTLFPFTVTCLWLVQVGPNANIVVELKNLKLKEKDCVNNYLLLRDGMDSDAPLLRRFCDNSPPLRFSTRGSALWVEYQTSFYEGDYGKFSLEWTQTSLQQSTAVTCGGIVTGKSGYISSPNYPEPYPNDIVCVWYIIAPPGKRIVVQIEDIKLERDPACREEFLHFRDGMSSSAVSLGRFCYEDRPVQVTSTASSLFVELRTDCKGQNKGFKAFWRIQTIGGPTEDAEAKGVIARVGESSVSGPSDTSARLEEAVGVSKAIRRGLPQASHPSSRSLEANG